MDRKRTPNSMCENRTLTGSDHGRQDKSAASGAAHVVGCIGEFRHQACRRCWRFRLQRQRFQCPERHPSGRRKRVRP